MNSLNHKLPLYNFILILVFFVSVPTAVLAAPSISTSDTTSNVSAGTNDQDASTTITTANVEEVKASRTLSVGALPGNNETITIGTCVVTYASSTGATNDELDCTDEAATIDRDTGAGNTPRTASDIATTMRTLTNVSDTGHGALTVGGSGTDVTFTTTGTESSATVITFTDGTSGDITSTSSTTGVIPVAQVNTITISGTVDTDDTFTATLPTVGAVTYTVTSSDTTTSNIATGLNAAIQASSGYASQDFTSAASTNTVVLTAKVAGTGFTQTSSASNRSATAQVTTFTPTDTEGSYTYTVTINSTDYTFDASSGGSLQAVVEGLQALVDTDAAVTCTEDDTAITCTAVSAGTSFTYSVRTSPSGNGTSGGIAGSFSKQSIPETNNGSNIDSLLQQLKALQMKLQNMIESKPAITTTSIPSAGFTQMLTPGMHGVDVSQLQSVLNRDPATQLANTGSGSPGNETTYYGQLTEQAVQRFQLKYGISESGEPGFGWFGPRTIAKMNELLGL